MFDDENVLKAIYKEKKIKMRFYILFPHFEDKLNKILKSILQKYNQSNLLDSTYTIIKEMIMNATKANIKHILLKEMKTDINNKEDYRKWLELFKEQLKEKYLQKHFKNLKKEYISVEIIFEFNSNYLYVEVINHSPMTKEEEDQVKNKFKESIKYDNLGDFYLENMDNAEGSGIGIIMILLLLRNQGLYTDNFAIQTQKDKTIASIKIPFLESQDQQQEHTTNRL